MHVFARVWRAPTCAVTATSRIFDLSSRARGDLFFSVPPYRECGAQPRVGGSSCRCSAEIGALAVALSFENSAALATLEIETRFSRPSAGQVKRDRPSCLGSSSGKTPRPSTRAVARPCRRFSVPANHSKGSKVGRLCNFPRGLGLVHNGAGRGTSLIGRFTGGLVAFGM